MDLSWLPPIILAVIGGGSVAALVTGLLTRGKTKADAAAVVSDSAIDLLKPLREEISDIRARLAAVEEQLRAEERRSWAAIGYIRRLIDSHRKYAPDAPLPDVPEPLRDIL